MKSVEERRAIWRFYCQRHRDKVKGIIKLDKHLPLPLKDHHDSKQLCARHFAEISLVHPSLQLDESFHESSMSGSSTGSVAKRLCALL